jgi:hypothetical protein
VGVVVVEEVAEVEEGVDIANSLTA